MTKRVLTDRVPTYPGLHVMPGGKDAVKLGGMTIDSLFAVCDEHVLHTARGGRVPGPWQSVEL